MRGPANTGALLVAESRTLTFDCTVTEQSRHTAQVTSHPVEAGLPVTDHVRMEPVSLTVQVAASTSPLGVPGAEPDAQRDRKFRADVLEIMRAREVVSILCELGWFEGFVISSVDDRQDVSTGETYFAGLTLTEVRRASRVVTLVPPDPATERRAQPAQDAGKQNGQATDAEAAAAQEVRASVLSSLNDGTGSLGARFQQFLGVAL